MNKNIFAKRLKEIRKKVGLSQPKLGEHIGMSRFSIIDYESGKTSPDIDTLAKIATVLKISVAYLMGETDDPTPADQSGKKGQHIVETFGQRLRKYRGEETQAIFAKKFKIAQSYLSELERDEKSPSRELLSSISKESGYSISYWMSEIAAPTPLFTCDGEAAQPIEDSAHTAQLDNCNFYTCG
jgi:transcriptional regulator with XRE-family HTH domain